MEHGVVLCGANSYEQKYYFNEEDFGSLPESIKKELHIMCEGNLQFTVEADESDYLFDEIGSALKIKQYQLEKRELLESLELYYRVFCLGEELSQ